MVSEFFQMNCALIFINPVQRHGIFHLFFTLDTSRLQMKNGGSELRSEPNCQAIKKAQSCVISQIYSLHWANFGFRETVTRD
jgi:hypothetical protein